MVSYRDKTIDLKTWKAYISWEKWYAIETSMTVPNSLDLKVKYQKERLEILEDIKTNEKILNLVENKINLSEELKKLKSEKSQERKNQNDLELDSQINLIEKELKKIDEKLKQAVPHYRWDQDEAFKRFLEQKIEKSKESLKSLKEKFDEDMQILLEKWKDEIEARDQNVRDTISFLDDLWITNINQNDLQKIINRININPQTYGFSKPIDLKKWFEGEVNNVHKQKHELLKLFSKIYQKMWIDISWTDFITEYKKIKAERWNQKEKFDINFKELLFTWWTFQIETFFTIIKEEPKENKKQEK